MADDKAKLQHKDMTADQKAATHKLIETAAIAAGAILPTLPEDDTVTAARVRAMLKAFEEAKTQYV